MVSLVLSEKLPSPLFLHCGLRRRDFTPGRISNLDDYDWVLTEYDDNGRRHRTSRPRSIADTAKPKIIFASPGTYFATGTKTETSYDGLNRVVSVKTLSDNQAVTTGYAGNRTTVTDQVGVQRRTTVDGLGRIVEVLEQDPDNSGSLTLETGYVYNPADQLIQSVQGVQVRAFHYDSAGRLLSDFHPESGATFYTYDDNGNLLASVDNRGKRIGRAYDELNRVTRVDYRDINYRPDSTPTVTYFYDEDSTNCPVSVAGAASVPQTNSSALG